MTISLVICTGKCFAELLHLVMQLEICLVVVGFFVCFVLVFCVYFFQILSVVCDVRWVGQ